MRKVIHMNIQIELQRRPEDYRLDNCVIDVVEEIPHDSFETFQNYPTARYGAITNSLHRLPEDTKDERHCILLLDADGDEGFIPALLEMFSETVNTLTDNSSIDEGNAATWKVSKG